MATDFTITMEDRPGSPAKLGETMGKAGVNEEGQSRRLSHRSQAAGA